MLAPPVEGALAPNPAPARDVPGLRRRVEREKNWKDEVRDRVRQRKQEKARDPELPLFRDPAPDLPRPQEPEPAAGPQAKVEPPAPEVSLGEPPPGEAGHGDPYALTREMRGAGADEAGDDDLPLNMASSPSQPESPPGRTGSERVAPEPAREAPRELWSLDDDGPETQAEAPVERPAFLGERVRAGAIDLLFLAVLWSVVVYFAYFAGKGITVGAVQLVRTWPWLVGYLSFLGLTYAAYFTGTTGQTLGKILGDLRVVDTAGRPPGYLRSFVRAGLGGLGVLLAGVGIAPMLVDPARRAFHDKLLGTRVVRK